MKKLQKGFILPVIIILIAVALGGGIYYYSQNKTQTSIVSQKSESQPTSTTDSRHNEISTQINGNSTSSSLKAVMGKSTATTTNPASKGNTWAAALIAPKSLVNIVSIDAIFNSKSGAEGLLSVYWDGIRLGSIDERYVLPGIQNYAFDLPGIYNSSTKFTLSFRLDSYTNIPSSSSVSNVSLEYADQAPAIKVQDVVWKSLAASETSPSDSSFGMLNIK